MNGIDVKRPFQPFPSPVFDGCKHHICPISPELDSVCGVLRLPDERVRKKDPQLTEFGSEQKKRSCQATEAMTLYHG